MQFLVMATGFLLIGKGGLEMVAAFLPDTRFGRGGNAVLSAFTALFAIPVLVAGVLLVANAGVIAGAR